jgi:hypothetical protein
VLGRLNGVIGLGDFTIWCDEHRLAGRLLRVCVRDAKGYGIRATFVTQQVIWKIKLFLERFVVRRCVETDAEDNGIVVVEFLDSITEPFSLDRSSRCVGFWIPPQQHVLTSEIVQLNGSAVLVGHRKRRGLGTFPYQRHIVPLLIAFRLLRELTIYHTNGRL